MKFTSRLANSLGLTISTLRQLLPLAKENSTALPRVDVDCGPVVSASLIHLASVVLPAILLALLPLRLASAWLPLLISVAVFAMVIGVLNLLKPSTLPVLIIIMLVALSILVRPPSLPWAFGISAVSYLAFRAATLASQVPRDALIARDILIAAALRDLLVLAITATIGAIALGGRQLTQCFATGVSVTSMSDAPAPDPLCRAGGPVLVVIGSLALLALALGKTGMVSAKLIRKIPIRE